MIPSAARRLDNVGEYYFSRKLEQIRRMNEAGRDVINLGIGSPDLPPSETVLRTAAASLQDPRNHGYSSYRGTPALRSAIGDWYEKTYAVRADAESEILPLLGSKEGLFYISMAFLNPGDQVLVPNPGYPAYAAAARLAGAEAVSYDLLESGDWKPDLEALSRLDLSRVKLMWVNYPHMPTGRAGSETLFQGLIEFGRRHGILICHDNPYGMVLNAEPPLSILRFDPRMEISLELNSFSKAFNMAGWRVGMLIAARDIIDTVLKVKSNVDSGMFLPLQTGAIEALRAPQDWHDERNGVYRERREWAYRVFDCLRFPYSRDQVGLFIWAKAPDPVASVEAFLDDVLERAAVFIAPGFIFGTNGRRYARCSLCVPRERLQVALSRLENLRTP